MQHIFIGSLLWTAGEWLIAGTVFAQRYSNKAVRKIHIQHLYQSPDLRIMAGSA